MFDHLFLNFYKISPPLPQDYRTNSSIMLLRVYSSSHTVTPFIVFEYDGNAMFTIYGSLRYCYFVVFFFFFFIVIILLSISHNSTINVFLLLQVSNIDILLFISTLEQWRI
jgi:hypothetical protein